MPSAPQEHWEQRFLRTALEWSFALGIHIPRDLVRRFPLRVIFRALALAPTAWTPTEAEVLRAAHLSARSGESPAALGDRVMLQVECGNVGEEEILAALPLDEVARRLPLVVPTHEVWAFLLEAFPPFGSEMHVSEIHRAYVRFLIERGLADGLLQNTDLAAPEVLDALVPFLSEDELRAALRWALKGAPASELLQVFPAALIAAAPTPTLWSRVLRPCLASALHRSTRPPPAALVGHVPKALRPPPDLVDLLDGVSDDVTVTPLSRPPPPLAALAVPPADDEVGSEAERHALVASLASVGRLPPNHADLPIAVLRGMELLYWGLASAESREERIDVFWTTFQSPDELHLALLALTPVFFPEGEGPDPSASTEALISAIELTDRRIRDRMTELSDSAVPPSDPLGTPLPSAPRLSESARLATLRRRGPPRG